MNTNIKENIYYDVEDIIMVRGKGIYLYDSNGKEYIDSASATFNLILGYSNNEVIEAVKEQLGELIHVTSSFQTNQINDLVKKLVNISPENLEKVHLKVSGGSEANEGAIKMAQYYTKKRDVISLFRSHLGQTYMMMNLSGNTFRKDPFPTVFPLGTQVPDPYCYRCFYKQNPETCNMLCVERINDFIEYACSDQVACIIIEPISGNGGNIVPPKKYFKTLKKLCEERNIVLIFDEIQTGFGRTGKMFAADYFGVSPNIMTVAKGLGGTGFQIAGILTEKKLVGLEARHHSFTFGANVMAAVAASKTLDIITQPGFFENVSNVGDYIMLRLDKMKEKYKFIGDVRGVGLMIGVEVIDSFGEPDVYLTNRIAKLAMNEGLIIRTSRYGYGNVFKIRPALNITIDEAEKLCDRLERVLRCIK